MLNQCVIMNDAGLFWDAEKWVIDEKKSLFSSPTICRLAAKSIPEEARLGMDVFVVHNHGLCNESSVRVEYTAATAALETLSI